MSIMNFIKKHTIASFAIAVGAVAVVASCTYLIVFTAKYDSYIADYERMQEEVNSKFAKEPGKVYIDGEFVTYSGDQVSSTKSTFKKSYVYGATDASINAVNVAKGAEYVKLNDDNNKLSQCITGLDRTGGAINFRFTTTHYGYADIEVSMRSALLDADNNLLGLSNLTDYIKISMNKMEIKTEGAKLDATTEFTSLVLENCFLLEGENVVTFSTSAYNPINTSSKGKGDQGETNSDILYVMPNVRNLTVFTDVDMAEK